MTDTKTKGSSKRATSTEIAPKKVSKPRVKKLEISANNRYEIIQKAAYFIALNNNFEEDPLKYWTEAESQVDKSNT